MRHRRAPNRRGEHSAGRDPTSAQPVDVRATQEGAVCEAQSPVPASHREDSGTGGGECGHGQ